MDIRILFAIVALLVVYWLVRSRFMLHSNSGNESGVRKNPRRRSGDRTLSAQWIQRSVEHHDSDANSSLTAEPAGRSITASGIPTPENTVLQEADSSTLQNDSESLTRGQARAQAGVADPTSEPVEQGGQSEVERLTELLQQRDRILARNRHAMEEVEKLKKKLFDKGREMEMLKQACARSDAALAHYRTRAQQAAMLEQQLAEAREQTDTKVQELQQLRQELEEQNPGSQATTNQAGVQSRVTEVTRRKNQLSKKQLAQELKNVEKKVEHAQQNTLELRRIRSELETVCADRANAKSRIAELQVRVQAQQQNEELREQLARVSSSASDTSSSMENSDSGSPDSSNP